MLVVAFAAATIVAYSAPAAPPDGTYKYTITQNGATIGTSTVSIKRQASSLTLHETQTRGDWSFVVDETLDANTLAPKTYVATYVKGDGSQGARAAFDGAGATVTHDGIPGSTYFRLPGGVRNGYVLESSLLTGFLMLPAQLHAARAWQFSQIIPSEMEQVTNRVSLTPEASRPDGVPAGSSVLSLAGMVDQDLWYDSASYVVTAVNVPIQDVLIKLNK